MDDIKLIVVPIDFSECSINALRFAAAVSKLAGAEIHLLTIIEKQNYFFLGSDLINASPILNEQSDHYEKLRAEIRKKLSKIAGQEYLSSIKLTYKVGSGVRIYKSITEYAQISKADMIIMGATGAHRPCKPDESQFGSNAERVSLLAKIPVITINKFSKVIGML